jgi:rhamnosyltransferase
MKSTVSSFTPSSANICAVVVTFHPDEGFAARVSKLADQVKRTIVVDNSGNGVIEANISSLSQSANIQLIENSTNVGVATALNQGVRTALRQSFKWVLTMDQDTMPSKRMIEFLCNSFAAYPKPETIAVIGSAYEGMRGGGGDNPSKYVAERTVITAGSLTSVAAFEKAGGFREDLFIDGVDEDFCLRVRRAGYAVLRATEVGMEQSIGAQTRARFIWRGVGISNHSAVRHYYMTRNRWILMANHLLFDWRWVVQQLIVQMKMVAFVLLFESNKLKKMCAMLLGFFHSISGRRGKLSTSWLSHV